MSTVDKAENLLPDRLSLRAASVGAVRVVPTRVGELFLVTQLPGTPGRGKIQIIRRCAVAGVGRCCLRTRRPPAVSNLSLVKKDCELEHECSAESSHCLPVTIHIAPA
jgi:hypothetical protein